MSVTDWAGTIYGYFFVACATGIGLWRVFKHGVHKSVEAHLTEMRTEFAPAFKSIVDIDKRTSRIEYALYNDGKTGLINKVEALLEHQQELKTDVQVIKATKGIE